MRKILVYLIAVSLMAFTFNGIAFAAPSEAKQVQKAETKININTATEKELTTLPGIGRKTAGNIVSFRQEKGLFQDVQDLLKVKGIGKKTLKKIENLISF